MVNWYEHRKAYRQLSHDTNGSLPGWHRIKKGTSHGLSTPYRTLPAHYPVVRCSPLATVSTAYGRCGEESTLLVAALRSVGIPARQVYTPRWAHTDDNHAWVEAWADGKWHFLGACEPEPVLDLGWFNAPASRGMLMHTKVFGRYEGKEEVMSVNPTYTEINVIDNYAPTAQAKVMVKDEAGSPVPDASSEINLPT